MSGIPYLWALSADQPQICGTINDEQLTSLRADIARAPTVIVVLTTRSLSPLVITPCQEKER